MTARAEALVEAGRLAAKGEPFVLATVSSVRRPASARPGDCAVVTPQGALVGWVGGACSEPIVVREALRALADGEPRRLWICPPGGGEDAPAGAVVAESGCASEGTVEVLVVPQLPAPLLAVVGESPAARTLAVLARTTGWRVANELTAGADAVVVAAMGRGDEEALRAALAAGIGYVGLVASARRAAAVAESLRAAGVDEEALARLRSPAGLDLGPSTQEEIAVAVLAELVAWRHLRREEPPAFGEAVDPVCGMTVAIAGSSESLRYEGSTYYFCCAGCRERFEREPARSAASSPRSC